MESFLALPDKLARYGSPRSSVLIWRTRATMAGSLRCGLVTACGVRRCMKLVLAVSLDFGYMREVMIGRKI